MWFLVKNFSHWILFGRIWRSSSRRKFCCIIILFTLVSFLFTFCFFFIRFVLLLVIEGKIFMHFIIEFAKLHALCASASDVPLHLRALYALRAFLPYVPSCLKRLTCVTCVRVLDVSARLLRALLTHFIYALARLSQVSCVPDLCALKSF